MSKYAAIPKEYYAATMLAIELVTQDGLISKAIYSSAKYYEVDRDELTRHVIDRLVANRKERKRKKYIESMVLLLIHILFVLISSSIDIWLKK